MNVFKYFITFLELEVSVNDASPEDRSFLDFVFDDGKFILKGLKQSSRASR